MQRVMSNGLKIVVLIVVTNSVFGKPQLLAKPVNPLERYKRQAEVSPSCSLECAQQGSECQVENGIAKCVCISCVLPETNVFVCASNNYGYFSSCFMNRAACLNNISLHEIECLLSSSTERPDNDLTTSTASTEIQPEVESKLKGTRQCCTETPRKIADKFTMKTNRVTYYQKCIENHRVQLMNCTKYDVPHRTMGFVHKNGKCKRRMLSTCFATHNHYKSRKECLNTCQNSCTKPISDEICSSNLRARLRFKFDVESKQCKIFVYLGCGRAGFKTVERCKDACIRNITLPNRCSSTCSQNVGRLFCTQDFVVAGKLKLITNFTHENPRKQLFVKLTRVFKDNHQLGLFRRIENVSSEATLYMNINTDRECPCPNITRKLAINESYPDNEFVISGMVVDGMATLNQGSFVKVATRELVRRMNTTSRDESSETVYGRFCNHLRRYTSEKAFKEALAQLSI